MENFKVTLAIILFKSERPGPLQMHVVNVGDPLAEGGLWKVLHWRFLHHTPYLQEGPLQQCEWCVYSLGLYIVQVKSSNRSDVGSCTIIILRVCVLVVMCYATGSGMGCPLLDRQVLHSG